MIMKKPKAWRDGNNTNLVFANKSGGMFNLL